MDEVGAPPSSHRARRAESDVFSADRHHHQGHRPFAQLRAGHHILVIRCVSDRGAAQREVRHLYELAPSWVLALAPPRQIRSLNCIEVRSGAPSRPGSTAPSRASSSRAEQALGQSRPPYHVKLSEM